MSGKHFILFCLSTLIIPETLLAHGSFEGVGGFLNGFLHPLVIPAHLLLLIAIGLFLGQQEPEVVESAFHILPVTIFVGLVIAWFSIGTEMEILLLTLSLTVGLIIAIKPHIKSSISVAIVLLTSFFLGIDSPQEELFGTDKLLTLFGSGVAIYFLTLLFMALAEYFNKKEWQKIGVRIIGSWVAASSLLVLSLSLSEKM